MVPKRAESSDPQAQESIASPAANQVAAQTKPRQFQPTMVPLPCG
jgi:hypothetical protein